MSREEETDAALVRRVRAGDQQAFALLFDRYAALLDHRAQEILSPAVRRKVSVADVLQEARIVAFDRFAEFEDRGEGSVRAWLCKIVENKAGDSVRRYAGTAKRAGVGEVTRGQRAATGEFAASQLSPSEGAMANESKERLRRVLAAM